MEAYSAEYLGLRDASDGDIADAALARGAIVVTKDRGFVRASTEAGGPPMIRIGAGNTSTKALKPILRAELPAALDALRSGDLVAEVGVEGASR